MLSGGRLEADISSMPFSSILGLHLDRHETEVAAIINAASKELTIELELKKLNEVWREQRLEIFKYTRGGAEERGLILRGTTSCPINNCTSAHCSRQLSMIGHDGLFHWSHKKYLPLPFGCPLGPCRRELGATQAEPDKLYVWQMPSRCFGYKALWWITIPKDAASTVTSVSAICTCHVWLFDAFRADRIAEADLPA